MIFPAKQLAVVIEIQIEAYMALAVVGIDTDFDVVAMVLGHIVVANIDALVLCGLPECVPNRVRRRLKVSHICTS